MPGPALHALMAAWRTVVIALVLFCLALAIAPIWDRTIFLAALEETLSEDHY